MHVNTAYLSSYWNCIFDLSSVEFLLTKTMFQRERERERVIYYIIYRFKIYICMGLLYVCFVQQEYVREDVYD